MANGVALTIGLNSVDPAHYGGWSGELNACEADAEDMAGIARTRGFAVNTLMTKAATRERVMGEISGAARDLGSGDIFMLSYSGHGVSCPTLTPTRTARRTKRGACTTARWWTTSSTRCSASSRRVCACWSRPTAATAAP